MGRMLVLIGLVSLLFSCTQQSALQSPTTDPAADIAGIELVEVVEDDADELVIPYRKYRLDNGLTLVLHEDRSDPLVHVDVTYHVGSAREEARRSGFAHFFEHMMFQGSAHVGDDEHFKIITESGGRMNGTTNTDRTNYFQTVPSNYLETTLWLESDRMGFLLEAVTQEKFEVQRATVKNERAQNYDNRPYGLFNEINNAALFPPDHPYAWPVIGYPEDLDAATLEDLKRFFLRWYGPNNATVSIGGDIERRQTLEWVVQYFGPIPAGPEVNDQEPQTASLQQDRYVSYEDRNIRFPALLFTFPTVPFSDPDRIALDCLADVIGDGRRSYLYKEFVLTQKAIEASAFHSTMELAGTMTFFVLPYPGVSLSEFETEMRDLFANFNADSISEEDVQICRASRESSLVRSLTSVQGKVSRLAYYQTFYDNPNRIQEELALVRNLNKRQVVRAFNQYVKDQPAVVQSVVPEGKPDIVARPDNYELPERPERQDSATAGLEPRPVNDPLDRSQPPQPGTAPLVQVPDFWRDQLTGNVDAIGTYSDDLPLVTIELDFPGGQLAAGKRHGLASLLAAMMNEGTENYSAEAFERELQKLGSRIMVGADRDHFQVTVTSLRDQLDETLDLLQERLFHSKLTEADLQRLRQQQIESIEADKQQPRTIADQVYRQLLYGADHPLAVSLAGKPESLQRYTLEEVEAFRDQLLTAQELKLVVVGELTEQAAMAKLQFLRGLSKHSVPQPPLPEVSEQPAQALYFVDKAGAPQSEIRVGYLTDLPYDATGEFFKRSLMNYVLGGAFNSRINMNLREDKGYTYGARSGFSGNQRPGPFTVSTSVVRESTADALSEIMQELTEYREQGITQEELNFMRSAIGQSEALDYETPGQKANFLGRILEYDLPADYVGTQAEIIRTISQQQINALAKKHLPLEQMHLLVVGDGEQISESLQQLEYPLQRLNEEGQPVD